MGYGERGERGERWIEGEVMRQFKILSFVVINMSSSS